ncbi:MAG: hypothetical protein WCE73_14605 [Candidatus Angelobacter sp.]
MSTFTCRILWVFLLAAGMSAFAQTALPEQPDRSDVAMAMKDLGRTEPSLSAEQAPSATQPQAVVQSQEQPVINPAPDQLIRIVPFGRKSGIGITNLAPTGAHLTYWGGPVISNIQVIAVFWGPNVSPAITANGTIDQFYTDITSSRYFDMLTEYTTTGIVGANGTSTSNQTIGHGTFAGKFTITPANCPQATLPTTACTVTDAQIQTELTNQINAGVLPGPQTDAHGIVDTYYAVYFPPNVNIQLDATTKSCVKGGFCAYHSSTGSNIPYGVMADFSSGGCSVGCGSGTTLQIATAVSSHEMSEAITDAQVGSANVLGPPLAWYDPDPVATPLGEIGDICGGQDVTVSAGSNTYTVQLEFSNLQNACMPGPPVLKMPGSGAGPGIPFNLRLTIMGGPTNSPLTNYTGTVHFTSSDNTAVLPADYSFLNSDAGTHTFQFTLGTLGFQTISVVDTRASGFTGSTLVNVSTATDLAMTVSPGQISALQGATGLTYTVSVRNNGGTATTGTVGVVIQAETGLTATAFTGPGWTCTLATFVCTRSDVLNPGQNYPDITVTFKVDPNGGPSAHAGATISGGGDTDPANNTDAATVNIGPAISIISNTPSATVLAGTRAQYVIGMNLGPGAGTVTFSCSGLPTAASCSFSPTSLTSSGNVTMTVSTTARAAVANGPQPGNRNLWLLLGLLSSAAMAGFCLRARTQPRRVRRLAPIFGTCMLLLAGVLAGCGGGSKPPTVTNVIVGTPAGTYVVTFTATSANGTASQTMNLTVN